MPTRFHIEDIITQDASCVVFRAIEKESGDPVAIRRFFPFGPDGGGLGEKERTAYEISLRRFGRATHPGLRTLLAGGCDPVDSVPFVVTEWIDGEPLSQKLQAGPLQSRQAIDIIMRALEVSEVLSQLVTEEAVWVETDPASIIDSSGRGVTFWISPLKWLGNDEERRSLKPIIQLTEDLMGWRNKLVNEQAGYGLAGWLKWLKQHAKTTTLAEARETLAAATGGQPPPPTSRLVKQSTRPIIARSTVQIRPKKKSSSIPVLPILGILVALGLGGWILVKGEVPFLSKFLPGKSESIFAFDESSPFPVAPANAVPQGPFLPGDSGVLSDLAGNVVILEAVLEKVRYSESGKTLYLEFETGPPFTYACGAIRKADAPADMTPETLAPLIGKRIRIQGVATSEKLDSKQKRPLVALTGRNSIEPGK